MKKRNTFKSILALALALLTLLTAAVPAFALEPGDEIDWRIEYKNSYTTTHTYIGELKEGKNEIKADDDYYNRILGTFNAEKAGYYVMTGTNNIEDICVPDEFVDGKPYNYAERLCSTFYDEGEKEIAVVYLAEGENYISMYSWNYEGEIGNLEIEYIGSELNDVAFDENAFSNLLLDHDLWYDEDGGICYVFEQDVKLVFADGATYTMEECSISLACESELKAGENNAVFSLFGIEKNIVLTCGSVSDYITAVEISNIEDYLYVKEYYIGTADYGVEFIENETLTITFIDGSKQTYELNGYYCTVTLPNGREYDMYMVADDYDGDGDACEIKVIIAEEEFGTYECETFSATDRENLEHLADRVGWHANRLVSDIGNYLDMLRNYDECYYYYDTSEILFYMTKGAFERIGTIISEVWNCLTYVIAN